MCRDAQSACCMRALCRPCQQGHFLGYQASVELSQVVPILEPQTMRFRYLDLGQRNLQFLLLDLLVMPKSTPTTTSGFQSGPAMFATWCTRTGCTNEYENNLQSNDAESC